jgi:hypothetical protein
LGDESLLNDEPGEDFPFHELTLVPESDSQGETFFMLTASILKDNLVQEMYTALSYCASLHPPIESTRSFGFDLGGLITDEAVIDQAFEDAQEDENGETDETGDPIGRGSARYQPY